MGWKSIPGAKNNLLLCLPVSHQDPWAVDCSPWEGNVGVWALRDLGPDSTTSVLMSSSMCQLETCQYRQQRLRNSQDHQIMEYPQLEGAHKEYWVQLLVLQRTTPRITMFLRPLSKIYVGLSKISIKRASPLGHSTLLNSVLSALGVNNSSKLSWFGMFNIWAVVGSRPTAKSHSSSGLKEHIVPAQSSLQTAWRDSDKQKLQTQGSQHTINSSFPQALPTMSIKFPHWNSKNWMCVPN